MVVEFEIIEDLSFGKVDFYTVKIDNDPLYEFEKFDIKDFPKHKEEKTVLYNVLNEIAYRGAKKMFFKFEGAADALPKVEESIIEANKDDFGIRLYCIRIDLDLVILINGDIKTSLDPLQCPNVEPHFKLANIIAKALDRAIVSKEININSKEPFANFKLNI